MSTWNYVKIQKVDTTKMFYGAVFLKKEDYILENTNPWGQGNSSWKWKGVLRDARDEKVDLEEELPKYFALDDDVYRNSTGCGRSL